MATRKATKTYSKAVWQNHHITYDPEWTVRVRRPVHYLIRRVEMYSKGFTLQEKAGLHCAVEKLPTIHHYEPEKKAKASKRRAGKA